MQQICRGSEQVITVGKDLCKLKGWKTSRKSFSAWLPCLPVTPSYSPLVIKQVSRAFPPSQRQVSTNENSDTAAVSLILEWELYRH